MVKNNNSNPEIDYGLPELTLKYRRSGKQSLTEKLIELEKLDNMQFEHYMARLFALKGYEVKYTPIENDYGADLIITRGNEIVAVRCLLGKDILDKDAVEAALESMKHYAVRKVMIVTNQMFTRDAIKFSRKKPVVLVDRPALIEDYLKMKI